MAKQLRLDVAQLTDVGRKREHNEDNMAHVIPNDPQVMTKKGALFIVADGMGGHAAGEVASEIAVDTISNVYYQEESEDTATSLIQAIKRANMQIHQRAAENMLRSGMGTTCVAAVLRGNMAYIANVGDSRAYLLRNGQVKQVSRDHSWVAEQVRAGFLTEDQARTHAQRNVITRCLGTQADVDIDIFSERLEENDSLVLCTDGLSGLVGDEELLQVVERATPQESVYHLVERANQNGGPDNITAIVVRVAEVGWEPSGARHPVPVGGRENTEDTAILGQLPGASAVSSNRASELAVPSMTQHIPSGPLLSPVGVVAPPMAIPQPKRRRRLVYSSMALLLLFVLLLVSFGLVYFQQTGNASAVNEQLRSAQNEITVANGESASNPAQAMQDLAKAQATLRGLLHTSLSSDQQQRVMNVLQGSFTHQVRTAIINYNNAAKFVSVPCQSPPSILDSSASSIQVKALGQVDSKSNTSSLFALGNDGAIYQFTNTNKSLVSYTPAPFLSPVKAISMASDGGQLVLLLSAPGPKAGALSYSIGLWSPGQPRAATTPISASLIGPGFMPSLITIAGADVYVALSSQTSTTTLLDYALKGVKLSPPSKPTQFSISQPISSAQPISSITALPNHQLVALLADGELINLPVLPGTANVDGVLVDQAVLTPLMVSADTYSWQTTVPPVTTSAPGAKQALTIPAPATVLSSVVDKIPHLYIMDPSSHRVLDFTVLNQDASNLVGAGSPTPTLQPTGTTATVTASASATLPTMTLHLQQQYASSSLFAQMTAMTVDPTNNLVSVLATDATSTVKLTTFGSGAQNGCSQP